MKCSSQESADGNNSGEGMKPSQDREGITLPGSPKELLPLCMRAEALSIELAEEATEQTPYKRPERRSKLIIINFAASASQENCLDGLTLTKTPSGQLGFDKDVRIAEIDGQQRVTIVTNFL